MALPSVKTSGDALPPFETSRAFDGLPVVHGFFGRRGGVSTGVYDSLNAGYATGDDPALVARNHVLIARAMGLADDALFSLRQVHGPACTTIGPDDIQPAERPEGDALVTARPGVGIGVLTGDCAPVLFAADGVVGAAHAGWGGALKGVIESTIAAMEALGAKREDIRAAVGPCIGAKSYEVSRGFETPFLAEDAQAEHFFRSAPPSGKLLFDLGGYCAYRLGRAGIERVDLMDRDTLALEDIYFSHRRTTLAGGTKRGLQLSVISLKSA